MSGYFGVGDKLGESKKFKIFRYLQNEDIHNEDLLMSIKSKNYQKSTFFTQDYNSKKNFDNKRLDLQKKISHIRNQHVEHKISTIEYKKAKTMASLVPDEIIYNFSDYSGREYNAALMFADVSGFTDLCEKYTETGKDGTSKMTQILNSYIGAMVQEILSHDGDLLKFSGDAFLAMWKSTSTMPMHNAVHTAIDCALVIQRDYGSFATDVDVVLKVKVALSAGRVLFGLIGDKENTHYAVVGQPVWDVKKAEYLCKAGDVIASPSAWQYLNSAQYITKLMDDGIHTNILGIGATWKHVDTAIVDMRNSASLSSDPEMHTPMLDSADADFYSSNIEMMIKTYTNISVTNIRQSVSYAMKNNLQEPLRRFILSPVMKAIENEESLEYLTEMRFVVILFMNVITDVSDGQVLLQVVDKAYKDVCRLVRASNGTVNKLSLFDKDMMFLIVFGLRGLKQEAEKKYALNCAVEIRTALKKHDKINSVSIGVTSGQAYCGVVGHKLRKEYTVIGLCVNKGARLMVAYRNKITCDKEVFLQSKLSENLFTLMPFKVLKGLSNVGPVYEYDAENLLKARDSIKELVGRDQELAQFVEWINKFLNRGVSDKISSNSNLSSNILIIQGEATIGKKRLLEEMIKLTPPSINVCKMALTKTDKSLAYNVLRKVIYYGLYSSFNYDQYTTESHEARIQEVVGTAVSEGALCFINEILNVNFPSTSSYIEATENQRDANCKEVLTAASKKIFQVLHIVAIHRGDCIDELSWALLPYILNSNRVALMITVELRVAMRYDILMAVLDNPTTTVMHLTGINRWHHSAIVCQILHVQAISPDLEKMVQVYSQGLIGWIEKFLQILLQSGQLSIKLMTRDEALSIGAVMPISEDMQSGSANLGGLLTTGLRPTFLDKLKGWSMFQSSFRHSEQDSPSSTTDTDILQVAILAPSYTFDSMQMEVSSNVTFLKTFDNLKPFEKLQLKCSAALGEIFSRTLLLNVMRCKSDIQAAAGFAKLFDIGFLECAGGDFTHEESGIFIRPLMEPTVNTEKKCHCIGLRRTKNENEDLPNYSWCGYMRFCNTKFFTYAYDLLTENQKKDFHNRAINYLEKNIRKCQACGGGNFNKLLGVKKDTTKSTDDVSEEIISFLRDGGFNFKYFKKAIHASTSIARSSDAPRRESRRLSIISQQYSDGSILNMGSFLKCECEMILAAMYTQIIGHCRLADKTQTLLEAYIEYAELKINEQNIQEAMMVLCEVDKLVHSSNFHLPENNKEFTAWQMNFVFGRIASLRGRALLEYGDFDEAQKYLFNAMALYEHPFPTTRNAVTIKLLIERAKQKVALDYLPNFFVGKVTGIKSTFLDQVSETLSYLFKYFMTVDNFYCAYLAAVWSLNCALKSNTNFALLCITNGNMITIGKRFNKVKLCCKIEACAMRMCSKNKLLLDITDVNAVTHLFSSIFLFRIVYVDAQSGVDMGYKVLQSMNNSKSRYNKPRVLTSLCGVLVAKKLYSSALDLCNELKYMVTDQDIGNKTWYYAKTLDFHLDAGYTLETYDSYCNFYLEHGENIIKENDPQPGWHFIINLWVRCLRTKQWDTTAVWFEKAQNYKKIVLEGRAYVQTALRYFEGLLLTLVLEMDAKNEFEYTISLSYLKESAANIKKQIRFNKLHQPRYYLLMAYYRHILYKDYKVEVYLEKCLAAGAELNVEIVDDWVQHAKKGWNNQLSILERDHWVAHCESGSEILYGGLDSSNTIPYTFPSPKQRFR